MKSLRAQAVIQAIKHGGLLNTVITADNLEAKRQQFKKLEKYFPIPRWAKVETVEKKDFHGEWISAPESRSDKVLLYLHGGGFVFDGTRLYRDMMARLARAGKVMVLSPSYSLAPEHPYPVAQNEVLATYKYLLSKGFAAKDIIVGGDSAGGALALSLMHVLRDSKLPMPAGVFAMSPATDATLSDTSVYANQDKDFYINIDTLAFFIDSYFGSTPANDTVASPLLGDLSGFPPVLLHVDKNEVMYKDSVRFADKAKKAGVNVELYESEGLFHVWHVFARYMPEAKKSIQEIGEFMQRHLK